jgi:hypothetical protein
MPATLIISALGITAAAGYSAFAIAAATFAVRLVTTLVISSIIAKRASPSGGCDHFLGRGLGWRG